MWVSGITYIVLVGGGVCYFHLITDVYSHKISAGHLPTCSVWVLPCRHWSRQLGRPSNSEAVRAQGAGSPFRLGGQYCCEAYVAMLQEYDTAVSMTEDYNPTDNAITERVNRIIKSERVYRQSHFDDIRYARNVIGRYIHFYNYQRPHMSIGYKVFARVHLEQGEQEKMWKKKIYPQKTLDNDEKNAFCLVEQPSRIKT